MKAAALICSAVLLTAASCPAVSNWDLQAVYPSGYTSVGYVGSPTIISIEGILLNRPQNMVNNKEEWQIYVQGEDANSAGTAVYMRKNNFDPDLIYSDVDWAAELYRNGFDPNGYAFAPGDRVRVTGLTMFYRGKVNINEQHTTDPNNNFTIELITPAAGLPQPTILTLADVKDGNDNFIFDHTRTVGCEKYQGTLVRFNNVEIIDANWQPNGGLVVQDNSGRTFDVKLGFGSGFMQYPAPSGNIDVIGIFDQEAPGAYPNFNLKAGYRLWVMNYDGNRKVLADEYVRSGYLASDVNIDGNVDFKDFAILAANWLECSDVDDCQ